MSSFNCATTVFGLMASCSNNAATVLPGNTYVDLNHGATKTLTLNLGAITRSVPG